MNVDYEKYKKNIKNNARINDRGKLYNTFNISPRVISQCIEKIRRKDFFHVCTLKYYRKNSLNRRSFIGTNKFRVRII